MARTTGSGFLTSEPLLLVAALILTLYFAQELLIPLAFALTLNFLLTPAVMWLENLQIRRTPAVLTVVAVAFSVIAAIGWTVSWQLVGVAEQLPKYQANIHAKLLQLHPASEGALSKAIEGVKEIGEDLAGTADTNGSAGPLASKQAPKEPTQVEIVQPASGKLQELRTLSSRIFAPLGMASIVVVFTIYLLLKREDLRNRLLLLAGMGHINLMTQALADATSRISQYIVMQFLVNAAYGTLFGTGLFLIGVPNATLWGVIAGILRIVPYVGTAVGVLLPLVFSLAMSISWWPPVLVIALFLALEMTTTNFVEPYLYGARTGISPLALVATAIFWTLLWGWPGLVLSTPLTVCVIIMGRYVPQMSFLHVLLGDDVELDPEAHFYERLLAMDQQEARSIAERYLQGKPLSQLYDAVLIPALSLAEQDRHKGILDDVRSNFFLLSMGELIAELSEHRHLAEPATDRSPAESDAPSQGKEFAVVCISASDQADELTTMMLAQLLEHSGHHTMFLSAATVSNELLEMLAQSKDTVVCVSALPPFAFSQARTLCQRVRDRLKENRIIVGLWNSGDDPEQTAERFGSARPNVVVNRLSEALEQIREWQDAAYEDSAAAESR